MMADNEFEVRVDDWVRFYRDGELVIGEVRYVHSRKPATVYKRMIDTDRGSIREDMIIEVRRLAEIIRD